MPKQPSHVVVPLACGTQECLLQDASDPRVAVATAIIGSGRADLDAVQRDTGDTALQVAIRKDLVKVAKALVDAGCNVNVPNTAGFLPFIAASAKNNVVHIAWPDAANRLPLQSATICQQTGAH
jgi:ankyrin repeat protein